MKASEFKERSSSLKEELYSEVCTWVEDTLLPLAVEFGEGDSVTIPKESLPEMKLSTWTSIMEDLEYKVKLVSGKVWVCWE